ncbi:MAG TPA: archease [Candidatus Lokiarchaeia archaeon]|nr:archease [Candidatus Lokiarchaeia archaeon]
MAIGHKFLSHPADIQVAAWAPTIEALFKEIGLTLSRVMIPEPGIEIEKEIEVTIEAMNLESLLVDWLSEFLFYLDSEGFVVGDIDIVSIEKLGDEQYRINSVLKGETFKKGHHVPGKEVKAITYSYLTLEQNDAGKYRLKIIFDI